MTTATLDRSPRSFATDAARTTALIAGVLYLVTFVSSLGIATLRAGVLPRWAAAMFAFGLPVTIAVVSLLPGVFHRLAAMPIGLGLAGLGCAVWNERHSAHTNAADDTPESISAAGQVGVRA